MAWNYTFVDMQNVRLLYSHSKLIPEKNSVPIFSDDVVWLYGFAQVVGMAIYDVLYTKIIKDEDGEDGALFVTSKARGGGDLVVPC